MNRHIRGKFRWAATAALLVAATSSAKNEEKKPEPPQIATAPAETTPSAKLRALEAVPHTGTTLSLFEQSGPTCHWVREDPLAHKRAVVAAFQGNCEFAGLVWSPDRQRALVRLGMVGKDEKPPRLWEVEVATGRSVELPPLPAGAGMMAELGYDQAGTAWLITQQWRDSPQRELEYAGRKYPAPPDASALGHAFSLDGARKRWKHVETGWLSIGEGTGWKSALNTLASTSKLVERASRLVPQYALVDPSEQEDEALAEQLWKDSGVTPGEEVGIESWRRLRTRQAELYVRRICDDFCGDFGPLMVRTGKRFKRLPLGSLNPEGSLAATPKGSYLLVSSFRGHAPVLIDLRSRKVVFDAPKAFFALFWPGPEKAGDKP